MGSSPFARITDGDSDSCVHFNPFGEIAKGRKLVELRSCQIVMNFGFAIWGWPCAPHPTVYEPAGR